MENCKWNFKKKRKQRKKKNEEKYLIMFIRQTVYVWVIIFNKGFLFLFAPLVGFWKSWLYPQTEEG